MEWDGDLKFTTMICNRHCVGLATFFQPWPVVNRLVGNYRRKMGFETSIVRLRGRIGLHGESFQS